MILEQLFFELLQVAIGTRLSLSVKPTSREWALLFEMAKKQALVAIAFAGVNRMRESSDSADDFGLSIGIDEMTYLKWLGMTAKVAQRNKELSVSCASLCKELAHDGLYACILKGQSNLVNYPEDLRDCRTPGDIDVWCGLMDPEGIDIAVGDSKGAHYEKYQGERGVIEWVLADWRIKGNNKPEVQYHHVDWEYKGVDCEVHFKPSWLNNPFHNARLQKWCKENEQRNKCEFDSFNIPTVGFNAVYQIVHIYRHLFNEGIGLRQLLDYYFVLKTLSSDAIHAQKDGQTMGMWDEDLAVGIKSKNELMHILSSFGMKPFASAVMWVLQEVFAMPKEYLLCKPDEERGKFLLNEIMLAGNFGKYDERNVIGAKEGYFKRFVRRQKRFLRFLGQYPSEVIWGPYFSVKQRAWRMIHGWR